MRRLVLACLSAVSALSRKLASVAHRVQFLGERGLARNRGWFDHYVDVHAKWPATGSPHFLERGVFGTLALDLGARALDLCCGDGFQARFFYANKAREVVAVDRDEDALRHARRFNRAANLRYERRDVLESLPDGPFDNVMLDAAIECFSDADLAVLLERVRSVLRDGGVLSGFTARTSDRDRHDTRVLLTKAELADRLQTAFPAVAVFETAFPDRTNFYFYASDSQAAIPFAAGSDRVVWRVAR